MISTNYDWTYEQVVNAVKDSDGEVTLDCEHTTITNMHQVVGWLESVGYSATISDDEERIYVKKGMTKEEAIDLLDNLDGMIEDSQNNDYDTALKMGIKALKREPILDKIRDEIEGMHRVILKGTPKDDWAVRWNDCIDEVLQIIDKHKAESR